MQGNGHLSKCLHIYLAYGLRQGPTRLKVTIHVSTATWKLIKEIHLDTLFFHNTS